MKTANMKPRHKLARREKQWSRLVEIKQQVIKELERRLNEQKRETQRAIALKVVTVPALQHRSKTLKNDLLEEAEERCRVLREQLRIAKLKSPSLKRQKAPKCKAGSKTTEELWSYWRDQIENAWQLLWSIEACATKEPKLLARHMTIQSAYENLKVARCYAGDALAMFDAAKQRL